MWQNKDWTGLASWTGLIWQTWIGLMRKTWTRPIAFMRVFPKPIVLTTKPRIDVYVFFTSKRDLVVRTIALGKTRISAICKTNVT